MKNLVHIEVIFTCHITGKRVIIEGRELDIAGHCANDEMGSDHHIEFRCPSCNTYHHVLNR